MVQTPEWSGVDQMEISMPTSKSTHEAIAGRLSDAAPDGLPGAVQREDRPAPPRDGAVTGSQGESSPIARPSARGNAAKLVRRKKQTTVRAKTRSPKANASRKGASKAEALITLLKRSHGASIAEMVKATGWQPHSLRGFLSATVKRRIGLSLLSERADGKDRRYRIV